MIARSNNDDISEVVRKSPGFAQEAVLLDFEPRLKLTLSSEFQFKRNLDQENLSLNRAVREQHKIL